MTEEPEAYRIGHVPFLGATIFLDSRPLIPRTETEWWVEQVVGRMSQLVEREIQVLDLFSGSGCVGVAILKQVPHAHVTFGELEARHLPTIEKNIRENGIDPSRTRVVRTDVWTAIEVGPRYDFILANPPYLAESRVERVEESVLQHEPRTALFAEDDGFALIDATIAGLPTHLSPGGQSWIEHEPEHAPRILESATRLGLSAASHKDQYGVIRYSVILRP